MFSLLAEAGGRQSANTRERASASREFLVVLRHGILGYLLEFFGHIALKLKETPKNKRRSFDETTLRTCKLIPKPAIFTKFVEISP